MSSISYTKINSELFFLRALNIGNLGRFTWKYISKLIFDFVEVYARRWAKQEDVEADSSLNGFKL